MLAFYGDVFSDNSIQCLTCLLFPALHNSSFSESSFVLPGICFFTTCPASGTWKIKSVLSCLWHFLEYLNTAVVCSQCSLPTVSMHGSLCLAEATIPYCQIQNLQLLFGVLSEIFLRLLGKGRTYIRKISIFKVMMNIVLLSGDLLLKRFWWLVHR